MHGILGCLIPARYAYLFNWRPSSIPISNLPVLHWVSGFERVGVVVKDLNPWETEK